MADQSQIGLTGLAVMGANLARNIARNGYSIAVHNRSPEKTRDFVAEFGHEGAISGHESVADFVGALARPRKVIIMVKAGAPVDAVIDELAPHLEEGDIVIDAGNSHFHDTKRRTEACAAKGLRFLGTGVSGGEEGALNGPSFMPGGDREAWAEVEEILTAIAVDVDGTPCCVYVGPGGAGHYVKMVHNGIEYADIQLIAEAYDLLTHVAGLDAPAIAKIFEEWNSGDLDSFLIEITAKVLAKTDEKTGGPLVDVIVDQAEQKGTGTWTKVDAYAQGFAQMRAASEANDWDLDLGAMATIWRGGCIIRARFLNRIRDAYADGAEVTNLLTVPYFTEAMAQAQDPWRRVIGRAVDLGIPVPAFSSCLAYYDGYRRARGPASLIQGQRDFFGAHTYRRIDRDGSFHLRWSQDGQEVPA